jgi:hypothetical protein
MTIIDELKSAIGAGGSGVSTDLAMKAIDEIERLRGNMYQAMHHAAEIWKENGQESDDQLGVVALILANGLGIIPDAALKEGE